MARQLGGFREWPQQSIGIDPAKIPSWYDGGFAGAWSDPEAKAEFHQSIRDNGGNPDGEAVAYASGLVGSGAGKLSIPFIYAYRHWPNCWPCPGQTTGDCVSHAGKNSAIVLIGVECELAKPDEHTGLVEGWPVVSAEAEAQGVVACENIYRARGHSGQGANCSTLQKYMTSKGGILLRKNYPELGIDLTKYNASIGIPGGQGVPESWNVEGSKHRIRTATDAPNHEACRDFVANGYPIWVCSGLGWSSQRDENGYSKRQGGWAHSWIVMGYDDRAETIQKYGFPLFLYQHDWGKWNKGGRRILGTNIDIPEGSFWADARLLDNCDCVAMSSVNGWPPQKLPDYLSGWI
jgi:hypothetical protein